MNGLLLPKIGVDTELPLEGGVPADQRAHRHESLPGAVVPAVQLPEGAGEGRGVVVHALAHRLRWNGKWVCFLETKIVFRN